MWLCNSKGDFLAVSEDQPLDLVALCLVKLDLFESGAPTSPDSGLADNPPALTIINHHHG